MNEVPASQTEERVIRYLEEVNRNTPEMKITYGSEAMSPADLIREIRDKTETGLKWLDFLSEDIDE